MSKINPLVVLLVIIYFVGLLVAFKETLMLTVVFTITGGIAVWLQNSEKGKLN